MASDPTSKSWRFREMYCSQCLVLHRPVLDGRNGKENPLRLEETDLFWLEFNLKKKRFEHVRIWFGLITSNTNQIFIESVQKICEMNRFI